MKRSLQLLCLLLLGIGQVFAWDGTSSAPANGTGTSADPYQITSANELAWVASQTNGTASWSTGKYFKLMNDVDLAGANWTPIGSATTNCQFFGNLNGNGHLIKNLTIVKDLAFPASSNVNIGLFGVIGNGATISTVGLDAYNISVTNSGGGKMFGGLVALTNGTGTTVTISDCFANGSLSISGIKVAGVNIGGFIGQETSGATVTVTNCYSRSTVTATVDPAYATGVVSTISGFVGAVNSATQTHSNCYASGIVSITANAGNTIKNCNIFVGYLAGATFTNCYTDQTFGYGANASGQATTTIPPTGVTFKDGAGYKDAAMPATLGTHYVADAATPVNAGYPVLGWQVALAAPVATDATTITSSGFTANWNAVAGATGYQLDLATDNAFSNLVAGYANLSVSATSQAITSLSQNTPYYYRVRAVNVNPSVNSNAITATTATVTATAAIGSSEVKCVVANGALKVENTNNFVVYNVSGVKVAEVNNNAATTSISLRNGIYLVKSGSMVQKVVVK